MAEGELGEFIFDLEGAKRPPHTQQLRLNLTIAFG